MTSTTNHRDERSVAVEDASYRLAYLVLSYGALALVAYRSFVRGEASWDLIGLVLAGGLVSTGYQARHRVLGQRWVTVTLLSMIAAGVVAAAAAVLR